MKQKVPLLIGTSNPGKFKEIEEMLEGLPAELLRLDMIDITEQPAETGEDYATNALLKARFYAKKSGMITLAEDSGIEVYAFPGELGHHTRRWGKGEHASDEEWLDYFLKKLKQQSDRRATFFCSAAVVVPKVSNQT